MCVFPSDSQGAPSFHDRAKCFLFVLIPWLILYEVRVALPPATNSISTFFAFERRIPVLEWTEFVYVSTYLWVCVAPLVASSKKSLRQFCMRGWLSMAIVFPMFFFLPFVAEPRPFGPHTFAAKLDAWQRLVDSPAAAFPSYHAVWALVALAVYEEWKPRWRWLWRSWVIAIAISCVSTGTHSICDVLAGFLIGWMCLRAERPWQRLQQFAESIANSWSE